MKTLIFAVLFLIINTLHSQVLIHSHNDYEKPQPLFNALRNHAFAIEADVHLVNGRLLVSHDRENVDPKRTLSSMYLDPLDSLFKQNKGWVSADKNYKPTLVVDIKADGELVIDLLIKLLARKPQTFDRKINPAAMQVIISGDRGAIAKWKTYPSTIMFDGRPSEVYDRNTLARVITISESYEKYYHDNVMHLDSLQLMIAQSHNLKKLVRIWGAPDFPSTWKRFTELGIDIINTDKIEECWKMFPPGTAISAGAKAL